MMDQSHRPSLQRRKTMTMNWAGLVDDDEDEFFESSDPISSARHLDVGSEDEDEFDDARVSFTSNANTLDNRSLAPAPSSAGMMPDYNIWMAAPGSITERRKRLLQGMGLTGSKQITSFKLVDPEPNFVPDDNSAPAPTPPESQTRDQPKKLMNSPKSAPEPTSSPSPSPFPMLLIRSRSLGEIDTFSSDRQRKEAVFGSTSKQRLTRTTSLIAAPTGKIYPYQDPAARASPKETRSGGHKGRHSHTGSLTTSLSNSRLGSFFLIKNLDTGKEFVVNGYDQDGMWNKLSDIQTGKQLTMDEFEKCVGHSPVVKELMRRESRLNEDGSKDQKSGAMNSLVSRSLRMSKRRGAAVLKSLKGVVSIKAEKDKEMPLVPEQKPGKNSNDGWVKVRQTGKSYKELSALHLCQEIHAHQGSIWTIRFSCDARFLASAGEDKVIHIWEVQECEVMSMNHEGSLTPRHPAVSSPFDKSGPLEVQDKKKKVKGSKQKANPIPDYVHVPETVCSLSDRPICSFKGHQDDILDLSWSRSQLLLSSSMDKTVRLWDIESKSCLKMFAHNDYVTCIHFNPVDDDYFISGSLDAKVRIWSVPDRQVVDWTDLHEMVTAACYAPDGQMALIGSHKGSCRMYSIEDGKLEQIHHVEVLNKKKAIKKITGFQFCPINPSEILVTSADSRVRIMDGVEVINKLRGFRNTNSQISASFSSDGKYIICASEDSNVYVWKREEIRNTATGKRNVIITRAHEQFPCKDVSVAIPWPGTIKGDPPAVLVASKRNSKRITQATSAGSSPRGEDSVGKNNKKGLPPLPKRKNNTESTASPRAEELTQTSRTESTGTSETLARNPSSPRFSNSPADVNPNSSPSSDVGDSASISQDSNHGSPRHEDSSSVAATPTSTSWSAGWSPSWSPPLSWFDGNANQAIQPTAWGLVIVTATLGGEIRVYQNFGIPRRVGRQTPLF